MRQTLIEVVAERLKNAFISNFVISWLVVNHSIIFYLLLSEDGSNKKLEYINGLAFKWDTDVVYPLFLVFIYVYVIPLINLFLLKMKLKYIEPLLTKYRNDHQELYYDGKISIEDKRLDLAFREKEREIDLEERRTDKQILKSKAVEDEAKSFAKRQDAEEKALQFESSRRVELEKIVKLDEVIERHRSLDDFESILNKEKERLVNEKNKYDLSLNNADWYSVDKVVSKGDRVLIDFVGEIDGIPFDGGSDEGHSLVIGSNTMIPGFEDGLTGKKAGDDTVVYLQFPDDYPPENLKGKKAQFKVKIHKVESLMISVNKLKLNSDKKINLKILK